MRRSRVLVAMACLGFLIVGCGGGLTEGPPAEPVKSSQTNEFRESMKRAGNKMMKGQMGKKAAAPVKGAEPADKAAEPADKAAEPAKKAP